MDFQKVKLTNRKAAIALAIIVALADFVIIYDQWLVGKWFTLDFLSGAKTAAFILLFVGSLIAEVQPLTRSVRWLLFAGVVLLCSYQAAINVIVNYEGAIIPPRVVLFFAWLNATNASVAWWAAVLDGVIRTAVVVIMWLVTGMVWKGNVIEAQSEPTALDRMLAYYKQHPKATQEEVANHVGWTRQTVGTKLKELDAAGVIHRNGGGVKVLEH